MRLATRPEHKTFMSLVEKRDGTKEMDLSSSQTFVLENYMTDCPGYAGPIGYIVWGGSPTWITVLQKNARGEWEMVLDTCRLLESDPRGEFERLNELMIKSFDPEQRSIGGLFESNTSELVELLDTGSVTMQIQGKRYVVTLNVKEE